MISYNNYSFNTSSDFNFSSHNLSRIQEESYHDYDLPVIAISVSVAIIAVICGIAITIEIRDRRRKKRIARMSSTASRNPIGNRGRYI